MADFYYSGRKIGSFNDEHKVFRKRVKKSKHLFKKYNAWGIQFDALCSLNNVQCREIRVLDEEENKVYTVPFTTMFREGLVEDFGHGRQVFLGRDKWTVQDYQPSK